MHYSSHSESPLEPLDAAEILVRDLLHDLRQPLGNIDASATYLNLVLRHDPRVVEHLTLIGLQVEDACRLLTEAAAALDRLRGQRAGAREEDILELTNPVTAAVT